MTGIIVSTPPTVELPPGSSGGGPNNLPPVTYQYALLNIPQTWTAVQTFNANDLVLAGSGGTSNVLVQESLGGPVTVRRLNSSDLTPKTQQIITSGATVTVATTDDLIAINKTVGSATTVNLPAASTKVGAVKVSDFKMDASTNNITVNVTGTDKLPGNLTSWTIAGDGASLVFTPLSDGSGYAI